MASLTVAHYRHAEQLIERLGPSHRLRTLDAMQLSVAIDLRLQGRIDTFVTADETLSAVAALEHLPSLDWKTK